MDSKHKWTWNDFVIRMEELSNAPKRFCSVVFKTLLREFEHGIMDTEEYGIEVLKDVFFPDGTVFTSPFPEGLIRSLLPDNVPSSVADTDKTKIRDDQIQQIITKMESQPTHPSPPSSPPLFEDTFEKLKSFCRDELNHDEALKRLEFVKSFNGLEAEWIIRILTCTVQSKLKRTEAKEVEEMQEWFNEVESKPLDRGSSAVIGKAQLPMLLMKTSTLMEEYRSKIRKFCGDSFYVETKYDGDRFHVHKTKKSYKFYSRKKVCYTEKFGGTSREEFAAKIHPLFKEDVTNCILDCEILVWDRKLKRFVGKNEAASDFVVYDVKNLLESKDDENRSVHRVLCVFDILHLNGIDLMEWTLAARLRILTNDIFHQDLLSEQLLFVTKYSLTMTRDGFLNYYNQAMTQKLEGIVVKSLYSTYQFGSRTQANGWFKIKPDYDSVHSLDLAIVAIRMDERGFPDSFELGAIIQKEPLKFIFVGTVSANIKQLDRGRILATSKGENGLLNNNVPEWLIRFKGATTNVKFIDIKNISVVEIRASGLMRGILRFPSIVRIRCDKFPSDCDTLKDVEEYEATIRKTIEADNESVSRKRKRQIKVAVPVAFKRFHSMNSDSDARLICCYNIKDSVTPNDLDELTNLGFSFITNLTKDCVCVVTDEPNSFKIKGAIKQIEKQMKNGDVGCHIVKGDWLKRCKEREALVAWKEEDIIYECPNATFSCFKDSSTVPVVNEDDEEEMESIDKEWDDLIAADSDPELSLAELDLNDRDEEMVDI